MLLVPPLRSQSWPSINVPSNSNAASSKSLYSSYIGDRSVPSSKNVDVGTQTDFDKRTYKLRKTSMKLVHLSKDLEPLFVLKTDVIGRPSRPLWIHVVNSFEHFC